VYQNNRIRVLVDTLVHPDGTTSQYTYYKGKDGIVVLPIKCNGNVIMIKQYRYLVGRVCLELPAGGIEHNETPLQASKRELVEETGFCAKEWDKKQVFFPSNGVSAERVHVYFAKDIDYVGKVDSEEKTEVIEVIPNRLKDLILSGEIPGASSLIALNLLLLERV
jgi:ADP-ribose pyrophosphatase